MAVALALHLGATLIAALYLRLRIERTLSVTGITVGALVLIHGVPLTVYLLLTGPDTLIYEAALKYVDHDAGRSRVFIAVATMFVALLTGIGAANRIFSARARMVKNVLRAQPTGDLRRMIHLGGIPLVFAWVLVFGMLAVSVIDGQLQKIATFFASGATDAIRITIRQELGGTQYYIYNVVLASVAPFMALIAITMLWWEPRSAHLKLLCVGLLFVVAIGKLGTLSKAPIVIFLLQVTLLLLLLRRRLFNVSTAFVLAGVTAVLFIVVVHFTMQLELHDAARFLYYRMFDIPNEGLLEYFSAIPELIPHGAGAGIFSFLRDAPADQYLPMYLAVADVTRSSLESTSNAMFIADAWAEFSWIGVALFSFLAGALIRSIDLYAFAHGESDLSACIVAGAVFGIFTMLSTALNTAMITGGLLLLPVVAATVRVKRLRRSPMRRPQSKIGQA